jgi:hypothetical protein
MNPQLVTVNILTSAGGAFSQDISAPLGRLLQYRYVPDGTTPLDTNADITVAGKTTGLSFINQANIGTTAFTKAPRQPTHDETGAASLYAAGGEPVEDYMFACGEQLTVTVAQGGATKAGKLYLWFG